MYIAIILGIFILAVIYLFPLAKVYGTSMYPTFKEGDILLCSRLIDKQNLIIGDIYIYEAPNGKYVIKRLKRIEYEEDNNYIKTKYWFEGDNLAESYDSRDYGYVPEKKVIAKVIKKLK